MLSLEKKKKMKKEIKTPDSKYFHSLFIFYLLRVFGKIADNGKSIGEERTTLQAISKETDLEQKFFPLT